MKKNLMYLNFLLITFVQFIFFYLFLNFIPNILKLYFFGFFAVLIVFTYLYDNLKSFTFLIAGMLAIGFYYVLIAWIRISSNFSQLNSIIQQLIVAFLGILIWIESVYLKKIIDNNIELEKKIKELEKYNPEIGVLTLAEFLDKAEVIFTAMKRRKENGQLLVVSVRKFDINNKSKTSKTILKLVGEAIIKSIRKQFDIVGYLNENTLIVLLQNTDLAGSELVVKRTKDYIANISNINYEAIVDNIKIEIEEVGNDFAEFKKFIENLQQGEEVYATF
ncbi:MAG TPA: hypothetical protein GX516_02535 [Thermoanaerobacter sp.]|nr:hypothetical protein [Thermoanaerobacter sp.]